MERLLADASDEPGVLPLLQETMVLLWDKDGTPPDPVPRRYERKLGQGGSERPGGGHGHQGGRHPRGLGRSRSNRIARRTLLRLVQFGEGRADTRRQQEARGTAERPWDDPAEFDRVLEHLTRHRLLTCSGEGDREDPVVDIALRNAPDRLAPVPGLGAVPARPNWCMRGNLEAKTREWIRLGSGRGGLLNAVGQLAEAERPRLAEPPDAADLGYDQELAAALVAASRARLDARAGRRMARPRRTRNTIVGLAAPDWCSSPAWRCGPVTVPGGPARRESGGRQRGAQGGGSPAAWLAVTQALAAQAVHQYTHGKRDERGALAGPAGVFFLFNQRLCGPCWPRSMKPYESSCRTRTSAPWCRSARVEATVTVMAFGPGHRHLAWAAVDGVLRVWDLHRPQDGPRPPGLRP